MNFTKVQIIEMKPEKNKNKNEIENKLYKV